MSYFIHTNVFLNIFIFKLLRGVFMLKPFSELDKLGIKSVAINIKGCRPCDVVYEGNTYDDWYSEQSPEDKYFYNFDGEIVGQDENCEDVAQIGRFWGTYIHGEELSCDEEYTFFDACDMIDQTMCNFAEAITNEEGMIDSDICREWDKIVYLDRIYIESEYRGYGIGTYIINNLLNLFWHYLNFGFNIIILEPVPQETSEKGSVGEYTGEDFDKKKQVLIEYYRSLGFKFIGKTRYMIKRTDVYT